MAMMPPSALLPEVPTRVVSIATLGPSRESVNGSDPRSPSPATRYTPRDATLPAHGVRQTSNQIPPESSRCKVASLSSERKNTCVVALTGVSAPDVSLAMYCQRMRRYSPVDSRTVTWRFGHFSISSPRNTAPSVVTTVTWTVGIGAREPGGSAERAALGSVPGGVLGAGIAPGAGAALGAGA